MPSWLCPTQAFELEGKPETDLDKALRAAISAASRDLNVELLYDRPYSYLYDYFGNELGCVSRVSRWWYDAAAHLLLTAGPLAHSHSRGSSGL